jgi:serine/threonine-protein kinase
MAQPETIDRFAIVRQVGIGGMGTVYEAMDPQIDRRVALKVLRRDVLAQNPELIERLWVEARATNSIRHPGVVQVSEAQLLSDGTGFLVMEFLDGQTLTQRLRQAGGRLPIARALQMAIQIASTLNAGHQKGIIHRDVKPDNVMLVPDDAVTGGERVKLLDFGIAKITSQSTASAPLTLNDMGLGTPGYMAPEQMRNAVNASDRSDIYGLGAVLFEMLSGRRPLVAPSTAELIVLLLSQDPPLLTSLVSDAPPELAALLARMLQREPVSQRPSAVDVLRELGGISGALAAPSSFGSGQLASPQLLPMEPLPTPPTLAHSAQRIAAGSARPVGQHAEASPDERSGITPPPSSSTISQMSGQTAQPKLSTLRSNRWLISGVMLGSFGLSLTGWWAVKNRARRALVPPVATAGAPAPAPPPALQPAPPAGRSNQQPVAITPLPGQPPRAESTTARVPSSPRALLPDASCIQGSGLKRQAKLSIANVLYKADVRLLPGEEIYLLRQGSGLEVDSTPKSISAKQVANVARMLETAISKNDLPLGLKRVHVQCSIKK